MKDSIGKSKGVLFSTSRSQERANKKNTNKARRQDGQREIRSEKLENSSFMNLLDYQKLSTEDKKTFRGE